MRYRRQAVARASLPVILRPSSQGLDTRGLEMGIKGRSPTPKALLRVAQGCNAKRATWVKVIPQQHDTLKGLLPTGKVLATTLSAGNLEMVLLQEGGKPSGTRP